MALITLQQMYDTWKRVGDWVSGANTDKPKVTVDNFPAKQNVAVTDALPAGGNKIGSVDAVLTGSNVANETNKAVTAGTEILSDYTAGNTAISSLLVMTSTSGTLSLEVDGVYGYLNGGAALEAGEWYAFDVPLIADSVYNLKFSVAATMQIKWIAGVA